MKTTTGTLAYVVASFNSEKRVWIDKFSLCQTNRDGFEKAPPQDAKTRRIHFPTPEEQNDYRSV